MKRSNLNESHVVKTCDCCDEECCEEECCDDECVPEIPFQEWPPMSCPPLLFTRWRVPKLLAGQESGTAEEQEKSSETDGESAETDSENKSVWPLRIERPRYSSLFAGRELRLRSRRRQPMRQEAERQLIRAQPSAEFTPLDSSDSGREPRRIKVRL